jgi:glycosyltransferase involved in cell wall biosynthesis
MGFSGASGTLACVIQGVFFIRIFKRFYLHTMGRMSTAHYIIQNVRSGVCVLAAMDYKTALTAKANPGAIWLSILIPVYNVDAYLRECVQSIMDQNPDAGIEIILLDDCSSDNSQMVAQQLCDQYPGQVRLISHEQNCGVSEARNGLLEAARGEYIWFVDSDDYLLPGALRSLWNIIQDNDPDIVLCDYRRQRFIRRKSFPGLGQRLVQSKRGLVYGVFSSRKMYNCFKICKRRLWGDDLRYPAGRTFEDVAVMPMILLRADSYYYEPKPWIHYRIRGGSIMFDVRRVKGYFDAAKHSDLVQAMAGIKDNVHAVLGTQDRPLNYILSNFVAVEFTKLAARYHKSEKANSGANDPRPSLHSYYETMQKSAPMSFEELQREYLKRLSLIRYFQLRHAVRLAQKEA